MRKIYLSIAAVVLGLGLTGAAANAAAPHRPGTVVVRGGPGYYRDHSVRFNGGYYYRGRDHHHWARRVWDPAHRRYQYWDSGLNTYFYWYAPGNCYYPTTYCP
ncbi:MAG TPA: hypothetical protein VEL76_28310 [Gemmataceae bacterium]|nr:hypothetical protein [Gemmataceae bacterium]